MASDMLQCPPQMNTDVSGVGIRISFYLQTLLLSLLSVTSGSLDNVTTSLCTLVATNISVVVAVLIAESKANLEISLQDGLVVLYLVSMSWIAVILSLTGYNRFGDTKKLIKFMTVVQSYFLLICALVFLIKMPTFGSTPECNKDARMTIFAPFNAIHPGRIIALCFVVFGLFIYTCLTALDCWPTLFPGWLTDRSSKLPPFAEMLVPTSVRNPKFSLSDDYIGIGAILFKIIVISGFWVMAVANTERLIRSNNYADSEKSQWQFGQILSMLLVVPSFVSVFYSFKDLKKTLEMDRLREQTHQAAARKAQTDLEFPQFLSVNNTHPMEDYSHRQPDANSMASTMV